MFYCTQQLKLRENFLLLGISVSYVRLLFVSPILGCNCSSASSTMTYQYTLDARFSFSVSVYRLFHSSLLLQVIVNVSNAVCSDFRLFLQICFLLLFHEYSGSSMLLPLYCPCFEVALLVILSSFRHW